VHLDNLKATKKSKRRWTGWVVAGAVIIALGNAQQISLSPSLVLLLPIKNLASFQIKRGEQKAPQDWVPIRFSNDTLANRGLLSGGFRFIDGSKEFQYALKPFASWPSPFCLRLNSCESSRAPPFMDPPTFC